MKYITALFLAFSLVGCTPTPEEIAKRKEEKVKEVQTKMADLNQQLHICDMNGGVSDISNGRYGTTVSCGNGVSATFNH